VRIDTHKNPIAASIVDVLIHRQDPHAERQARPSKLLEPNANPHFTYPRHGPQVLDIVGAHQMVLVWVSLLIQATIPAHRSHPERSDRALEQEQIASVMQDLQGIEIVEVDTVNSLVKPHGHHRLAS